MRCWRGSLRELSGDTIILLLVNNMSNLPNTAENEDLSPHRGCFNHGGLFTKKCFTYVPVLCKL